MTTRVNGGIGSKETLTGNMDFFTVHTVAAIEEGAYGSANSAKRNLIRMVEAVSMGAQPVLVSVSSAVVDLSVAGNRTIYGLGTNFNQAATTVFTLKFAIEHTDAFGTLAQAVDAAVAGSLASRLNGLAMPFTTAAVPHDTAPVNVTTLGTTGAATANTSITAFAVL
jgi:hypothetical protein